MNSEAVLTGVQKGRPQIAFQYIRETAHGNIIRSIITYCPKCIVTCIPIARQRVGKHIPATQAHATVKGDPLLYKRLVNTHSSQQKTVFFVGSVPRSYKRAQSEDGKKYTRVVESSRVESSELAAAEMVRKELGLWKEDIMCELMLQCHCDKSVERIWLVKTEIPSAWATVNCKVCRIAIAL
jgi:hypothetical protein